MEYQESKSWANGRYENGGEARALEAAKAAVMTYLFGDS